MDSNLPKKRLKSDNIMRGKNEDKASASCGQAIRIVDIRKKNNFSSTKPSTKRSKRCKRKHKSEESFHCEFFVKFICPVLGQNQQHEENTVWIGDLGTVMKKHDKNQLLKLFKDSLKESLAQSRLVSFCGKFCLNLLSFIKLTNRSQIINFGGLPAFLQARLRRR